MICIMEVIILKNLLNVCYNPINITSIDKFIQAHSCVIENTTDVYFVRLIGMDSCTIKQILDMDKIMQQRSLRNDIIYIRVTSLSQIVSSDVNYYSSCYENWIKNGKKNIVLKSIENNLYIQEIFSNACNQVLNVFSKITSVSQSMEKNFVVKLMFWFDKVIGNSVKNLNKYTEVKIVAENINKKQEYLFFYMLTQMGYNVLLIQTALDIPKQIEDLHFSSKYIIGNFNNEKIPPYNSVSSTNTLSNNKSDTPRVHIPERNRLKNQNKNTTVQIGVNNLQRQQSNLGNSSNLQTEKTFEELALLAESVVMIQVKDRYGKSFALGSGIMISKDGYILTNYHVVEGGFSYSVKIENDNTIYNTNELIKYNNVADFALIRIDRRLSPIPIYRGNKPLVRGQKVVAIGSPLGLFNSVSNGIISGFRLTSDEVKIIQFTAPISSGSSGGAVINMQGELIGISKAGFDDGQNLNLAVQYDEIYNFVKGFL